MPKCFVWLSIGIVIVLVSSGCESAAVSDAPMAHMLLTRAVGALAHEPNDKLSVRQLEAMIGKPDMVLGRHEFDTLLKGIDSGVADLFREAMSSALSNEHDLNNSRVLVYAWKHPMEFRMEIVGGLTRRRLNEHWSYAYVISDSRVVFARYIKR